jgi:iron complex outermembrane receptor protein
MTLNVIPTLIHAKVAVRNWSGNADITSLERDQAGTLEARLKSNGDGPFQWVGGVFASNDHRRENQYLALFAAVGNLKWVVNDDKTAAAYFNGHYSIAPTFRVMAGVRETWEKKYLNLLQYNPAPGPYVSATIPSIRVPGPFTNQNGLPVAQNNPYFGDQTVTKPSFSGGFEWDVAPQSMAYLTYSTGFKAGGLNVAPPALVNGKPPVYQPETLNAYELGIKNRFFDDRLQINIEGFYWKYDNKQEQFLAALPPSTVPTTSLIVNAAGSTLKGGSVNVIAAITRNDRLFGSAEYLHANYDTFRIVTANTGNLGCPKASVTTLTTWNCDGIQMIKAPTWSGNLGWEHDFPMASGANLGLTLQMQFASSQWLSAEFLPQERAPGYHAKDFYVVYDTADKHWSLSAGVKNFDNALIFGTAQQNNGNTNISIGTIEAPRMWRASANYKF